MTGLGELAGLMARPDFLVALAALGFAVGTLTGLFGIGGGFLVTPLLIVAFGIDESLAVGSDLCAIIGTSAGGLMRHRRLGHVEPRTMVLVAVGAVCGILLGTTLHESLRAHLGQSGTLSFPVAMRGLYLILLPTAGYLALRGPRAGSGRSVLQRLPVPPRVSLPSAGLVGVSLPGLLLLGLVVGVLTGLLGVGGGVLYVPVLLVFVGLDAHRAIGTSLGVVLLGAMVGTIRYALASTAGGSEVAAYAPVGNVSLPIAMCLLVGSTLGVQLGAWICHKLHASRLRKYFAVIVFLTAVVVAADLVDKIVGG